MSKDDVTDLTVLRGRIVGILERVAAEKRPCRLCGEMIYLLDVEPKPVWYSKTGDPHEFHCSGIKPK